MVILTKIPEDSCSSSLLTIVASLLALVFNMEEGTGQGPCQGILWLLCLLSPGSLGVVPFGPCANTSLSCLGTPNVVQQSVAGSSQVP